MSENEKELDREYKLLLNYVKEKISKESKISLQETNQCHNRYLDIGSLAKFCFANLLLMFIFCSSLRRQLHSLEVPPLQQSRRDQLRERQQDQI